MLQDTESGFVQAGTRPCGQDEEFSDDKNSPEQQANDSFFKPIDYREGTQQIIQPPQKRGRGRPRIADKFHNIHDLEKNLLRSDELGSQPTVTEDRVKQMRQ